MKNGYISMINLNIKLISNTLKQQLYKYKSNMNTIENNSIQILK